MRHTTNVRSEIILWLLVALLALNFAGCSTTADKAEPVTFSGETMGTRYNVQIFAESALADSDRQSISDGIDTLLAQINRQMSVYDKNSEITAFNNSTDTGWFPVSAATAVVFAQALDISAMTKGALDITVGPFVDLWGFGPATTTQQIPSEKQIEITFGRIGYRRLSVRLSPPAVKKDVAKLRCDLGAVAKGFGVDKIAEFLQARGYTNYLVEIGGEIRASGVNPNGIPWQVGVQKPETDFGTVSTVSLNNICMATSGDYQSYFEIDGKKYSHLIDPRTGRPIAHKLASVTIIDQPCMRADAIATALNVLGPEDGYSLAVQTGLAAQFIIREGDSFVLRTTPNFKKYLQPTEQGE